MNKLFRASIFTLLVFIGWVLLSSRAAAVVVYRPGTTGLTLYVQFQTGATTFKGIALTESPSSSGIYQLTDAAAVSGGLISTDGDYPFWIYSGSATDTPSATPPLTNGDVMGWTGIVERPRRTNVTYFGGAAGAFASGIPAVSISGVTFPANFSVLSIDAPNGRIDVGKILGVPQTGRDVGGAVPPTPFGSAGGIQRYKF